ncbi:MAG: DUF1295 domain-containing protein [Xanthomonadales bacterium]|nr:DUF1295 domain-containing protein [Xanthomonadales bacterium]
MNWMPILHVLAGTALVMVVGFEVQRRTRNAGGVDVIWAGAMGSAALYYSAVGEGAALPRLLTALLGGMWGFRLCLHLLGRVLREAEDGRYRYLRGHWHDSQPRFFAFYMLQAGFTALFSIPFWVVANQPATNWTPWLVLGVLVWAASLAGETIADRQLIRFRRQPESRGRTCRTGLWRYSRHPNYFFEWLHWFGWVLMAVGAPWQHWAWLGPVLMGASLMWITGVPFTEAQSLRSRGDDYRRYQEETSVFIPWWPKTRDPAPGTRDP